MTTHKASLLYASKKNEQSAAYLQEIAADLCVRRSPPVSFAQLTKDEEHIPMLNQIINKVCNFFNNLFISIVYIAMIYISDAYSDYILAVSYYILPDASQGCHDNAQGLFVVRQ